MIRVTGEAPFWDNFRDTDPWSQNSRRFGPRDSKTALFYRFVLKCKGPKPLALFPACSLSSLSWPKTRFVSTRASACSYARQSVDFSMGIHRLATVATDSTQFGAPHYPTARVRKLQQFVERNLFRCPVKSPTECIPFYSRWLLLRPSGDQPRQVAKRRDAVGQGITKLIAGRVREHQQNQQCWNGSGKSIESRSRFQSNVD